MFIVFPLFQEDKTRSIFHIVTIVRIIRIILPRFNPLCFLLFSKYMWHSSFAWLKIFNFQKFLIISHQKHRVDLVSTAYYRFYLSLVLYSCVELAEITRDYGARNVEHLAVLDAGILETLFWGAGAEMKEGGGCLAIWAYFWFLGVFTNDDILLFLLTRRFHLKYVLLLCF